MTKTPPNLFLDSNVFVETVLSYSENAKTIFTLASSGLVNINTCEYVIHEVKNVIQMKITNPADQQQTLNDLQLLIQRTRVLIHPNPSSQDVLNTLQLYLPLMRHKADIPVLTAALLVNPKTDVILSGNRNHFNDQVAQKCGIPIYSCGEFLSKLDKYL